MKRMLLLLSMMVLWATCIPASGQGLKPLKSFGGDQNEYLKANFEEENVSFKGCSFGDLINTVEAKFLTTKINYQRKNQSLYIELYLQDPDFVNVNALKEKTLTGLSVSFEKDDALKEATQKVYETFSEKSGPSASYLTKENMNKLIGLLKNAKIRMVLYENIKLIKVWLE